MTTQTGGFPYDQRQRLTPDDVRGTVFERAPLGRRGFEENEVQDFLDQLADELEARDAEIARLTDENRRLKHGVREWHRRQEGFDAADLMARTQQQIDAQIAQAEEYSREREEEATRLYDQIVNEARQQAGTMDDSGTNGRPDGKAVESHLDAQEQPDRHQQAYVTGLLQALDALAAHVDATRQAFSLEIGRLGEVASGLDGATRSEPPRPEPPNPGGRDS